MERRRPCRASPVALATIALGFLSPWPAHAQARREFNFLGPPSCAKETAACHKKPTIQWRRTEPQTIGPDAHYNTKDRLTNDPKSREYLSKLKWSPDDSRCTKCHATVVPALARGRPMSGVSCESCHGAGEGYVDVHQEIPDNPAKYEESLQLGLADLRKGPKVIAAVCVRCHVVSERDVLGAGHPTGADWKADQALTKIVHWDKRPHSPAELKLAFDPIKAGKLKGVPPPEPTPTASARPATTPTQRPGPPPSARPGTKLADIPELPPDFMEPAAPPKGPSTSDAPPPTAPSEPRPIRPGPLGRVNLAPDEPAELTTTQGPAGVVEPVAPPVAPAAAERTVTSPLAEIARLRQRVLDLVGRLLERRAQQKPDLSGIPAALPPAEYKGPDGELLRIQDEILRLALEALRKPPDEPTQEVKP